MAHAASSFLARTARTAAITLGLSGLLAGCESVPVADASVADAGLPGEPDAARDADADADAANDPSSGDAALGRDGATSDAVGLDGGSNTDGAAPGDTGTSDAEPADAAYAQGPSDAAVEGVITRTHSGEVSWPVQDNRGSLFCEPQVLTLWGDETITLVDAHSRGFRCDICPVPAPGAAEGSVSYYYKADQLELRFDFRDTLQRGHSLAAFRDTLLFSTVTWKTTAKSPTRVRQVQFFTWYPVPEVEFVSYEAPLLHVRVHAVEVAANGMGPDPTPPYPCLRQTPAGPLPDVCTEAFCSYAEPHADRERGVRTTLDVTLPVEPPHEGLSAP